MNFQFASPIHTKSVISTPTFAGSDFSNPASPCLSIERKKEIFFSLALSFSLLTLPLSFIGFAISPFSLALPVHTSLTILHYIYTFYTPTTASPLTSSSSSSSAHYHLLDPSAMVLAGHSLVPWKSAESLRQLQRPSNPSSTLPSPVVTTNTIFKDYDPVTGNKIINSKYMIIRELGRGVHGKVKLAQSLDTGGLVVRKRNFSFSLSLLAYCGFFLYRLSRL